MSKKELIELLTELLGPLSNMVLRQIDKFVEAGLTYKDIARTVYYLFDVQGRDRSKISTFGIGLVPHAVVEANRYYDNIKKQQEEQRKQVLASTEIPTREVSTQERKIVRSDIDISEL